MNYPGGQFALTQFWNSDPHAGPPGYLGPNNTWTIHGLWPDHCDGRFDSVCDCDRSGDCSSYNHKCSYSTCNKEYSSITRILEKFGEGDLLGYMGEHWKGINGDEHLWQHEWSKHGTCVSTLEPGCYVNYTSTQEVVQYFHKAVEVYKTLPSFEVGDMRFGCSIATHVLISSTVARSSKHNPLHIENILPRRNRNRTPSSPQRRQSHNPMRIPPPNRAARDLVPLPRARPPPNRRFHPQQPQFLRRRRVQRYLSRRWD